MKRILATLLIALVPYMAMAQATATPTPTSTATFTPDALLAGHPRGAQAYYKALTTVLPTAVPTAYSTPQVRNSAPLQMIDVVNESDCAVVLSLDGGGADNFIVPSKSALDLELGELGLHHSTNINIRGQAACTAGNVYVGAVY